MPKRRATKGKKKNTPFADAGEILGDRIGRMVGYPMLRGLGRWLGTGIGTVVGSGDYQMIGPQPKYNVLTSDVQVPQFSSTRQTNIVCHREYLADIQGTTAFTLKAYSINPGAQGTFPWLSTVAENYQEYRIHGLIYEFKSMITDNVTSGAPGMLVMATNYNASAPSFSSKHEMENSEFAVATKPTNNLIHGVECAETQTVLPVKFVRGGTVPAGQDSRLYDLGTFQIATQGNPNQVLGELWVSYCVEFFKPLMPATTGGSVAMGLVHRTNPTSGGPLGTIGVSFSGTMDLTYSSTQLSWTGYPGDNYVVDIAWSGTSSIPWSPPNVTPTNLVGKNFWAGGTYYAVSPATGATTNYASQQLCYTCNASTPGTVTLAFTGGAYPTNSTDVTIMVSAIDSSLNYP